MPNVQFIALIVSFAVGFATIFYYMVSIQGNRIGDLDKRFGDMNNRIGDLDKRFSDMNNERRSRCTVQRDKFQSNARSAT